LVDGIVVVVGGSVIVVVIASVVDGTAVVVTSFVVMVVDAALHAEAAMSDMANRTRFTEGEDTAGTSLLGGFGV
jgi:hypothetical protein